MTSIPPQARKLAPWAAVVVALVSAGILPTWAQLDYAAIDDVLRSRPFALPWALTVIGAFAVVAWLIQERGKERDAHAARERALVVAHRDREHELVDELRSAHEKIESLYREFGAANVEAERSVRGVLGALKDRLRDIRDELRAIRNERDDTNPRGSRPPE